MSIYLDAVAMETAKIINLETFQKALHERRKTNIRDAAKEIGIAKSTLSNLERGTMPTAETYAKVCRWLGVSLEHFTRDKNEGCPC